MNKIYKIPCSHGAYILIAETQTKTTNYQAGQIVLRAARKIKQGGVIEGAMGIIIILNRWLKGPHRGCDI